MDNIIDYICELNNMLNHLDEMGYESKELEYAIQKLSEAVYWLSYVKDDLEGDDNSAV